MSAPYDAMGSFLSCHHEDSIMWCPHDVMRAPDDGALMMVKDFTYIFVYLFISCLLVYYLLACLLIYLFTCSLVYLCTCLLFICFYFYDKNRGSEFEPFSQSIKMKHFLLLYSRLSLKLQELF